VRVVDRIEQAAAVLEQLESVKHVQQDDGALTIELKSDTHDLSFLARALVQNRFAIQELREEEVNLETAFMRLTKGIVQ
jgi:ABC-2 type transport system ATP-binding protein